MKQSEVLALLHKVVEENQQYTTWTVSTPHLVILVNKAIEAEREACAKWYEDTGWLLDESDVADAIRARGNET